MPQFAKLFNVKQDSEQVIMQKVGYNEENDTYDLKLTTQVQIEDASCTAEITLGFNTEEEFEEQFEKYDQAGAEQFRQSIETQFV